MMFIILYTLNFSDDYNMAIISTKVLSKVHVQRTTFVSYESMILYYVLSYFRTSIIRCTKVLSYFRTSVREYLARGLDYLARQAS